MVDVVKSGATDVCGKLVVQKRLDAVIAPSSGDRGDFQLSLGGTGYAI